MSRLALSLSLAALAALGACRSATPPWTDVTGTQMSYRAGYGTVVSVAPAPASIAAAGASGQGGTSLYRLAIKMDDGRMQYVDADSPGFAKGQRVELSEDRLIGKQ